MSENSLDLAVADFASSIGLLRRKLRAAIPPEGMSLPQITVMTRLEKEGPATTAELARAEGMKPQSMGAIVAALEAAGFVRRKPHPSDGRQAYIELTTKGAALRKTSRDAKLAWLTQAFAGLEERDRKTLLAAGSIIKRMAEM